MSFSHHLPSRREALLGAGATLLGALALGALLLAAIFAAVALLFLFSDRG